jgi:site-specific DNA-methyltransferase (adenine-specific)
MEQTWDSDSPPVELWRECLRVLKPGAHLLAFSSTRTVDFIMGRIRDAGFEIRDMLLWLYGTGFPKNLDVSKAIDKKLGAATLWNGWGTALKLACKRNIR